MLRDPAPNAGSRRAGRLVGLATLLLGSCHVVESKTWNLAELHDDATHHRYSGAIEGDTEYFFRHQVAGAFAVTGAQFGKKDPVPIEDPSQTCLENLVSLEEFDAADRRVAAAQVEWFARIAVEDPWILSRERAVHALAAAAKRLKAGVPAALGKDETPAGAQAAGEALAGLVRASRPILDRGARASASERLDLEAACRVVSDLVLDLNGARRMLRASGELAGAVGDRNDAGKPLVELAEELQRRCTRQALAKALFDREPRVRAAAVEASVASAGPQVLDEMLAQLDRETSAEVLLRVLELVRRHGLPEGVPAGVPAGAAVTPETAREVRLKAIFGLLDHVDSAVRVGAMRTLGAVSGAGFTSLREEDWQTWWRERPKPAVPAETP